MKFFSNLQYHFILVTSLTVTTLSTITDEKEQVSSQKRTNENLGIKGLIGGRRPPGTYLAKQSLGHSSMQVPQSVHFLASTAATSSTVIAPLGQASSQSPQPTHSSTFTFTTIVKHLWEGGRKVTVFILFLIWITYHLTMSTEVLARLDRDEETLPMSAPLAAPIPRLPVTIRSGLKFSANSSILVTGGPCNR